MMPRIARLPGRGRFRRRLLNRFRYDHPGQLFRPRWLRPPGFWERKEYLSRSRSGRLIDESIARLAPIPPLEPSP